MTHILLQVVVGPNFILSNKEVR